MMWVRTAWYNACPHLIPKLTDTPADMQVNRETRLKNTCVKLF